MRILLARILIRSPHVRKPDLIWLAAILFVAAGLRVWAPWDDVLGSDRVNFLETDAWYHIRLVENQVRNFPHRVTVDPYASPGGQYVAVAPLLDTVIATAVFVTQGRDASVGYIERVAAMVPAVVGVLAVAAVWALATIAFDRRAGLIAGLLAAILPGHFLDRTLVGFVDHHALEVLLSFATLLALALSTHRQAALPRQEPSPGQQSRFTSGDWPPSAAGLFLGLYLLAWASGAYFVAILTLWIILVAMLCPPDRAIATARNAAIASAAALIIVVIFQDPLLFRYNTQIASLAGFLGVSLAVMFFARRFPVAVAVLAVLAAVLVAGAWMFTPALVQQVTIDLNRFRPDPQRMAVLEARPLFLYSGNWDWTQPWIFFRSGFYAGALAVIALAISIWRTRRPDHLLIVCFTFANYAATIGQNRFGYYLVPATAVVCGWLATRILDWGGVPHAGNPQPPARSAIPFQRELAVIAVAGVIVAPNVVPAAITTTRVGGMPGYWFDAMKWLRTNTAEPFASPDYYLARYDGSQPPATYSILNWWDQGYWIVQTAHRVPVANPTQGGAPVAARFFTETDEAAALTLLTEQRARYVIVDWELPFRGGESGALAGRFQNLADWAGIATSHFYTVCFSRATEVDAWQVTWLFYEPYYQSMVYRLMVLGGTAVTPANNTYVVETRDRVDASGRQFCEVVSRTQHATPADAKQAAKQRGPGFRVVGLTPWQPAFATQAISGLREVASFRETGQQANEAPMIRIFEAATPRAMP
jgi:oligosaccharyl transferase (archaeosortase A-associated)